MVAKKRKSKRQTLQQKYKIIKRTKEHHRKIKKGKITGTANERQRKNALKKAENRIPNAWPYKEDLLKEIETAKEKMEELKQRQKESRKQEMVCL
jgi:nuclear GTP-binding protein